MIKNIMGYIYSALGGALVSALFAVYLSSNYYGAQIAKIEADHRAEISAQIAEVSKTALKWRDYQDQIISDLRASLDVVTTEGARKVKELETTVGNLRSDVRAGRVLIDRQAKALADARADQDATVPAAPAAENGHPTGALSAETSAAILDLVEEAELVRISLIEQREYAVRCHSAHSNAIAILNALLAGEDPVQDSP